MRQALLINIWKWSAIPYLSSSVRLDGGRRTFSGFSYVIGFKLRLCLSHWRTFTELSISHSCCVFRSISPLEDKPSAQSEVLNALDWVSIKAISIFWCVRWAFLLFWWVPQSLPLKNIPTALDCYQHNFTFGMVLGRWWAELVPFKHDA